MSYACVYADLSTSVNQIYISKNDIYYSQILQRTSNTPALTCTVHPSYDHLVFQTHIATTSTRMRLIDLAQTQPWLCPYVDVRKMAHFSGTRDQNNSRVLV